MQSNFRGSEIGIGTYGNLVPPCCDVHKCSCYIFASLNAPSPDELCIQGTVEQQKKGNGKDREGSDSENGGLT